MFLFDSLESFGENAEECVGTNWTHDNPLQKGYILYVEELAALDKNLILKRRAEKVKTKFRHKVQPPPSLTVKYRDRAF